MIYATRATDKFMARRGSYLIRVPCVLSVQRGTSENECCQDLLRSEREEWLPPTTAAARLLVLLLLLNCCTLLLMMMLLLWGLLPMFATGIDQSLFLN